MAGYIGSRASVVSSGAERKKTFDITGTTTVLTGLSYTPTFVHLFHNGVRLVDGTDYTATNGTSITLTTAAQSGDQVVVVSYATFQAADAYTKAEADAGFVSDPNGAVTVDGSGFVGIGTSSPAGMLQISSTFPTLILDETNTDAAYQRTQLALEDGSFRIKTRTSTNTFVSNDYVMDKNSSGATNHAWRIGNTERMRISSSGNVGIGTASPSALLDVMSASNPSIKVRSNGGTVGNYAELTLQSYNNYSGSGQTFIRGVSSASGNSNTDLTFGTNSSGFGAPASVCGLMLMAVSLCRISQLLCLWYWGSANMTSAGANPVYNVTAHNTGNCYNTANGVFTAQVGGVYYFAMGVYMFTNTSYNRLNLTASVGVFQYKIISASPAGTGDRSELLAGTIYLNAGDTCYPTLQSTSNSSYYRAQNHSWFEGYLLG